MATERKPWPEWAANDYYVILDHIRYADKLAAKALDKQHDNVHLTGKLLSCLLFIGLGITSRVKELELRKRGDDRWPNWVSVSLTKIKLSSRYISAGAKHGLEGIDKDNWKAVLKGINTCKDHIHSIEAALLAGPQPAISDDLLKTLEIGETRQTPKGDGWRKRRKTNH